MSSELRIRLATFGALALPVGIVLAANWLGGEPTGATAAGEAEIMDAGMNMTPRDPSAARDRARIPASRAALERVAALDEWEFETPPLHVTGFSRSTERETVVDSEGLPSFSVQAVLAARGGNIALLDGNPYRVGDIFGNSGWTVIEISSATRSVSIGDSAGRVVTRTVPIRSFESSESEDGT